MRRQLRHGQDSTLAKLQRSGDVVNQDDGGQEQQLGGPQQIDDVFARACSGLLGLLMRHEWIGGEG